MGVYASQDVRGGNYRMPDPKDSRKSVDAPAPFDADYNAPIPFA